jgi:lipopolysaccharide/colanic/teichoic acid biosynthesis glycosyltransferase
MNREGLLIRQGSSGVQNNIRNTVRNLTQQASRVAELPHAARISTTVDQQNVVTHIARLQRSYYVPLGEILPKQHFLKQLQREKSRTDRSKAPLSIALFSPSGIGSDVTDLLELLSDTKRETDTLGYLGEDRIAILLPDTNEQGAQRLAQKIVHRASNLPLSTVTRTYPDQLFDNLIAQKQEVPDLYPLLPEEAAEPNRGYFLKRGLDIVGAIVALLMLSPLMLLTAIAVAMSSPGPVIFRQVRLGKRGVPFVFYKFRSMYCDADDRIHREYVASLIAGAESANQGDAEKPVYKLKSDPRVTTIGRFIRRTSLDELPQFFSVLKGDMSLVGPRPPLTYEVEKYQSWHLRRILEVRPGITGLWQVEGRSRTSFDEMVRLDLRYIRSCSLGFDLNLLFRTVKVVLGCDGAK